MDLDLCSGSSSIFGEQRGVPEFPTRRLLGRKGDRLRRFWRKPGEGRLLCRFLDAGNNEALGTLSCQASKKRQGTKSQEVGHWLGSERYGDLMSAPTLMVGATL
jgi:hypothetical protein